MARKSQSGVEVARAGEAGSDDMRERIRLLALQLLVRFGVRGCTFGDIADALSITRANVHYHFGSKTALIDEVVADYVEATAQRLRLLWSHETLSLDEKIEATIALDRARCDSVESGQAWNLITRMRGEEDALSAKSISVVRQFTVDLGKSVLFGMEQAVRQGELASDTPVEDVAVHLVNIIDTAGLTTMDADGFGRLETVYRGFFRMLVAAHPGQTDVSEVNAAARQRRKSTAKLHA